MRFTGYFRKKSITFRYLITWSVLVQISKFNSMCKNNSKLVLMFYEIFLSVCLFFVVFCFVCFFVFCLFLLCFGGLFCLLLFVFCLFAFCFCFVFCFLLGFFCFFFSGIEMALTGNEKSFKHQKEKTFKQSGKHKIQIFCTQPKNRFCVAWGYVKTYPTTTSPKPRLRMPIFKTRKLLSL